MFLSKIVSIISYKMYSYFTKKDITIKMPNGVPDQVAKSFSALLPVAFTLTIFVVLKIVVALTPFETLQNLIYTIVQEPLTALGRGLPATIVAVLFIQVFWFFGLHGQIIVNTVFDPIWYSLNNENLAAFKQGVELPNIITKQFIDTFLVGMGGTGGTLAVVLGIYLLCRSKQNKEIAKLGTPASIFNVNEPILLPVIITIVSYTSMYLGLVPKPSGVIVPWTTPIFISGYLATGNSWQGAMLQLVNLVITFVIWWPFLKLLDKNYLRQEKEN